MCCIQFQPKINRRPIEKIHKQKEIENISNKEKINHKNTCWSSQSKKILKFTKEESKLFPLGKISFTKLGNFRQLLNNYSQIAKQQQTKIIFSKKCKNVHF